MKPKATSQRPILAEASQEHLQRLAAIPLLFGSEEAGHSVHAKLVSDSWNGGRIVGRRDLVDGHTRRTAFLAGKFRFELVAERRANQWEFVGRVYCRGRAQYNLILTVGAKRLAPDAGGFFHWTSAGRVAPMMLVSENKHYALESMAW